MRAFLRALRARLSPDRHAIDPEAFQLLSDRVAGLESLQTARELEWADTRERLLKYLRRIEGTEARRKQLEAQQPEDGYARARAAVVAMKFNRNPGA